jgi:hypothetical protein
MAKESENDFGIASLVFGVLSIIFSLIVVPAIPLGIIGLVFGFVQRKKNKNPWANWGIALSIIGLIIAIIAAIFIVKSLSDVNTQFQKCINDPTLPECSQFSSALSQMQSSGYGTTGATTGLTNDYSTPSVSGGTP